MQSIDHVSSVMSKWGRATAKGDRKVLERFPGSKEVLDKVLSMVLDSSGYGSVLERFQRRYPKRHTFQHTSRAVWDVTWANLTKELSICYKFVHQLPILRPLTLRHCTWGSCLYIISSLYHSMLIIYMLSTNQDKFSFVCAHPSNEAAVPLPSPPAPSHTECTFLVLWLWLRAGPAEAFDWVELLRISPRRSFDRLESRPSESCLGGLELHFCWEIQDFETSKSVEPINYKDI